MKNLNNLRPLKIAVIGAAVCDDRIASIAYQVGQSIAHHGGVLISGGRSGVMEASCRGACEAGGITIGILPGTNPSESNQYVIIPLPTGLGHARNAVLTQCADAVIAISGGYGTLSEIALALKMGKPVLGIETRADIEGLILMPDPESAVSRVFNS
ncbi:TIGR00725 family protein [bacterium]|nr:TIGR00725 family protein [candidate division CSSED10-310 bacterium]